MRFLQMEWHSHERARNSWDIERAEMKAKIAKQEGEIRHSKKMHDQLNRQIRMLEIALKKERTMQQSNGLVNGDTSRKKESEEHVSDKIEDAPAAHRRVFDGRNQVHCSYTDRLQLTTSRISPLWPSLTTRLRPKNSKNVATSLKDTLTNVFKKFNTSSRPRRTQCPPNGKCRTVLIPALQIHLHHLWKRSSSVTVPRMVSSPCVK